MKNIKLTIAYDGTHFNGWQKQKKGRTVQGEIEKALIQIMKKKVSINGSGRTDAGVHALGQVANFREKFTIPIQKIAIALNSLLSTDIAIKEAVEVDQNFHARYNAVGKKYIYKIYNRSLRDPFHYRYSYFVPYTLDIEKMKNAAQYFIGEHDFRGFMATGSSIENTIRTIYSLVIYPIGSTIIVEVKGNGFLYNMVRIIVGTLVEVGRNKIDSRSLPEIIQSCDRERAGHTAPPQGLYLAEVYYSMNQ
jgi:tRNA pseudouridine38-40 synthase